MNYSRIGKGMMFAALILSVCVALLIEPVTGLWIGLISLAFFLSTAGLTITSYGEATSQQQENHTAIVKRLDSLEEQIQKEFEEQKGSHSSIAPTLQAFTQFYLDYLSKQQSSNEQQNNSNDT